MKIITEGGDKQKFVEFKSAEISAEDFNKAFESKKVKKYDLDGSKFVVVKDDETGLSAVYCLENGATTAKMVTRYELNKEKGITIYYTAAGEKTQEFATFESDLAKKIANTRITRDESVVAAADAAFIKECVDSWAKEIKPAVEAYDAAKADADETAAVKVLVDEWAKEIEPAVEAYKTAKEELAIVSMAIENGESKVDVCKTEVNAVLDVLLGRLKDAGFEITGDNIEQRRSSLQAILEPVNGKDISQRFEGALRVTAKNEEQVLAQVESFKKVLTAYESARKEMDDNKKQLEADREIKNDCEMELAQQAEALKKANAESKNIEELKKHESIKGTIEELLNADADAQTKALKDMQDDAEDSFADAAEAFKKSGDALKQKNAESVELTEIISEQGEIAKKVEEFCGKDAAGQRDSWEEIQSFAKKMQKEAKNALSAAKKEYADCAQEKTNLDIIIEEVVSQKDKNGNLKYDALYRSVKGFLPILREDMELIGADDKVEKSDGIVEFSYKTGEGKSAKACIFLAPAPEVKEAGKYERFDGKLKEYIFFGSKKKLLERLFEVVSPKNDEDQTAILQANSGACVIDRVLSNDNKKDEKFKAAIVWYSKTIITNGQFEDALRNTLYIDREAVERLDAAHEAYRVARPRTVDRRNLVVKDAGEYKAVMQEISGTNEYKGHKDMRRLERAIALTLTGGVLATGAYHLYTYVYEPTASQAYEVEQAAEEAQRKADLAELKDESAAARIYGIKQGLAANFSVAYDKDGKPVYRDLPTLENVQVYKQQDTGALGELSAEENETLDRKYGYTEATQMGVAYGLGQKIATALAGDGVVVLKRIGTDGTETNTYYFDEATLAKFDEDELRAGYDSVLEDLEIDGNSVIAEGIDPINPELINAAEDKVKDGIVSVVKEGNYAYAFSEDGQTAYRIAITDGKNVRTTEEFVEAVKNGQYEAVFTSAAALFKSDKAFWQDKYISGIEYSTTKVGKVEYFVVDESGVTTKKTADVKWIGASAIPNDMTMTKVAIAVNEENKTISIKGASDVDASAIVESKKVMPQAATTESAAADEGMGLGD